MAARTSVAAPEGHAARRRRRGRLVMLVVAIGAVASATAAATAGGLLTFRDAGSGDADFPASKIRGCYGPADPAGGNVLKPLSIVDEPESIHGTFETDS